MIRAAGALPITPRASVSSRRTRGCGKQLSSVTLGVTGVLLGHLLSLPPSFLCKIKGRAQKGRGSGKLCCSRLCPVASGAHGGRCWLSASFGRDFAFFGSIRFLEAFQPYIKRHLLCLLLPLHQRHFYIKSRSFSFMSVFFFLYITEQIRSARNLDHGGGVNSVS